MKISPQHLILKLLQESRNKKEDGIAHLVALFLDQRPSSDRFTDFRSFLKGLKPLNSQT